MSRQETLSAPEDDLDAPRGPVLSIVVTLFDEASTLEELQQSLGAPVLPVTNVRDIVSYLSSKGKLPADRKAAIEEYLGLYGAP